MNIGQKLLDLRKSKQLSQEEVANKLNVTRQTISKWETDQSMPDFDKIIPICELYGISADELLSGTKNEKAENEVQEQEENKTNELKKEKRAKGIGISVLIYFVAVAWIMTSIPAFRIDPIISSAIFLLICGIATCLIIYTCIVYKKDKKEIEEEEREKNTVQKQISEVLAMIVLIIYLLISFVTMAWHIAWILWVVYGLVEEIIKLIFMLRRNKNEK